MATIYDWADPEDAAKALQIAYNQGVKEVVTANIKWYEETIELARLNNNTRFQELLEKRLEEVRKEYAGILK